MKQVLFAAISIFVMLGVQPSFATSSDTSDDTSYSGCPLGGHDKKKDSAKTS